MFKKDLSWKIYSLLPIIIILIVLTLIPLVNIFYNSFFDIRWDDGKYNYTYIGLENYIELPNNKFYFGNIELTREGKTDSPKDMKGVTAWNTGAGNFRDFLYEIFSV